MNKVIECVPNFSEGKNPEVIDAIAKAISDTSGVILLDVDSGVSTNRTVITFVGDPEAVVLAAVNAALTAYSLIDMTKHKGEHPRMGALDVCPFIPVRNVTIDDCVKCAHRFAKLLAENMNVPVYMYGAAATMEERRNLPQVRAGEYEGLPERFTSSDWTPDYGEAKFVARWGATACGVRNFLIAYNVNVLGTKEQAHRIALNIREQGRSVSEPGRLNHCRAIGWYLEDASLAQVSINLTDYHTTPMHVAFEECKKDATELNLAVTGSEIVGLVPLEAILQAAEFYIKKENLFVLEEKQKVRLAIERLGLNSINHFHPEKRIIEYCLPDSNTGKLVSLSVYNFVHQVADRTPTPGGGSVAALCGALGAGLASMVGKLTFGKKQWHHLDGEMRQLIPPFHHSVNEILPLVDADTEAFNDYMTASRLPSSSDSQLEVRELAMQRALQSAVETPLQLMRRLDSVWPFIHRLAGVANSNALSDLKVAVCCMETASKAARFNVNINLANLQDGELSEAAGKEAETLQNRAEEHCKIALQTLRKRE